VEWWTSNLGYLEPVYGVVPISGPTYGDNSFGDEMLTVADRYMTTMDADGLYFDELENVSYGEPLLTYDTADGHTCLLDFVDGTYEIERDGVGLTQLLSEEHHQQIIGQIQATTPNLGGTSEVLGNGAAHLQSVLDTGIQRMVESQHSDLIPTQGHLQTPLAYLAQSTTFSDIQRLLTFGLLPVGTVSTTWATMGPAMKQMFPITPIELHMGYILGVERIIAAHGGTYGWPDAQNLVLPHFFDENGGAYTGPYSTTVDAGGSWTTVYLPTATWPPQAYEGTIALPGQYAGDLVILEKLPVAIEGEATVEAVAYGPDEVSMTVSAKQPVTLRIASGAFLVMDGESFDVTLDSGKPTTVEAQGAVLEVSGVSGRIQITHGDG
jgi:hypothetical protein